MYRKAFLSAVRGGFACSRARTENLRYRFLNTLVSQTGGLKNSPHSIKKGFA